MDVGFCESCKMVQLVEMPDYKHYIVPDESGKTNYAFYSSTSKFMEMHFASMAEEIEKRFLGKEGKVLEIGCNDGIMLKAFKNHKVLGVEPSANVAEIAQKLGIEVLIRFFDEKLSDEILLKHGKFRTIASTNVFLNIIDIESCMKGISKLLDDKGVFITEDPYILDILEKNAYDQIYDEHVWYFSLTSLENLYSRHGLEIFDAEKQWVHGGSMRVYACKKGAYAKSERLKKYLALEKEKELDTLQPYLAFARHVERNKDELSKLITGLKSKGKKIAGYAAASKGTIVMNYCNIGAREIEYISDSTPYKQGKLSPGKHIPVVSPEKFHEDKSVDYALLSAWNHAGEIMEKEKEFIERGGRFIVHLPFPHIVEKNEFSNLREKEKGNVEGFEGVVIKKLNVFANDQGYLYETLRADDSLFDGEFGQGIVSVLYPGTIKGLHKHSKQTDYTTCVKGNIKYVLAKENIDGSASIKTFAIGENNHIMIKVPPGYWHGYMPLGNEEAIVVHIMDTLYNPKDDDTDRKDAYAFGDVWSVKPS